jgi:hypothetical protein
MLLRISKAIDDVHGKNCILHRLINFCLQIAGVEYIILKNSYRTDEVLIHGGERVSAPREDATDFMRAANQLLTLGCFFSDLSLL